MELEHTKILIKNGIITYGGNQSWLNDKIRKTACGMIAACDMLLRFRDEKCTPVSVDEYVSFVTDIAENYFYNHSKNLTGVPVRKILKALNNAQSNCRFRFISRLRMNKEQLTEKISSFLSANLPVIVRIGENGKKLPYKIIFPESGNISREGRMRWHYITAVGIEKDTLVFYSWGGRGEMKISDLHKYFGLTGGIIIAE